MKEWDGILAIVAGGGIGLYAAVQGWRWWRERERSAAVGSFLLAVVTVILPLVLAWMRE